MTKVHEIVFVTGGTRSGKSHFAQTLAESWEGKLLYLATAEVRDEEMRRRVDKHIEARGERWASLEEPVDIAGAIEKAEGYGGILIDCLTIWTSNLMEAHGGDEERILAAADALAEAVDSSTVNIVIVTNEVGSGIVPVNKLAREFRDLAGIVNQRLAAIADRAFLIASGRPLLLG